MRFALQVACLVPSLAAPSHALDAEQLSERYQHAVISRGDHYPGVDVERDQLDAVLVLLHRDASLPEIAEALDLAPQALQDRIARLVAEGLVGRGEAGRYRPAAPVISLDDAARHFSVERALVDETADLIVSHLPGIRARAVATPGLEDFPFENASLLILSNVVLDNPQIDTVEADFLDVRRPLRGGGRYYFSLNEGEPDSETDRFGIYGNHWNDYGDVGVGLYGNRRYVGHPNLVTVGAQDLVERFGFEPGSGLSVADARAVIARDLVRLARTAGTDDIPEARRRGMAWLGLIDEHDRVLVPILTSHGQAGLQAIADHIAADLLGLLERHRRGLRARFAGTPYARDGVRFEEWFIWWYHFFYTEVTDVLIERGAITLPRGGNATYLVSDLHVDD